MLMPEPTLFNSIIYWVVVFSILVCSNPKFRRGLTKNRIIAWTFGHLDLVLLLPVLAATLYLKKI